MPLLVTFRAHSGRSARIWAGTGIVTFLATLETRLLLT